MHTQILLYVQIASSKGFFEKVPIHVNGIFQWKVVPLCRVIQSVIAANTQKLQLGIKASYRYVHPLFFFFLTFPPSSFLMLLSQLFLAPHSSVFHLFSFTSVFLFDSSPANHLISTAVLE